MESINNKLKSLLLSEEKAFVKHSSNVIIINHPYYKGYQGCVVSTSFLEVNISIFSNRFIKVNKEDVFYIDGALISTNENIHIIKVTKDNFQNELYYYKTASSKASEIPLTKKDIILYCNISWSENLKNNSYFTKQQQVFMDDNMDIDNNDELKKENNNEFKKEEEPIYMQSYKDEIEIYKLKKNKNIETKIQKILSLLNISYDEIMYEPIYNDYLRIISELKIEKTPNLKIIMKYIIVKVCCNNIKELLNKELQIVDVLYKKYFNTTDYKYLINNKNEILIGENVILSDIINKNIKEKNLFNICFITMQFVKELIDKIISYAIQPQQASLILLKDIYPTAIIRKECEIYGNDFTKKKIIGLKELSKYNFDINEVNTVFTQVKHILIGDKCKIPINSPRIINFNQENLQYAKELYSVIF